MSQRIMERLRQKFMPTSRQQQSDESVSSEHHMVVPNDARRFPRWRFRRSNSMESPKHPSDIEMASAEDVQKLQLNIARLFDRLSETDANDLPQCPDEECLGCVTGRASVLSYPCGHTVLCRRCFIRTIQIALGECNLPVRCVLCRTRVVRLRQIAAPRTTPINGQANVPVANMHLNSQSNYSTTSEGLSF